MVQWIYPRLERTFPALAHRFFVTIFFTPLNYRVPEKEKLIKAEAEKSTWPIGGKKIRVYVWGVGAGPVVLLIHGWAGRATQFRKFIPELVGANFRVVGFDGPAHGESTGRSTNIQEFETVLRRLYERFGTPEGIIAHSFGGGAALYAAMKGLPVKKLINIASPTIGDQIIHTYLKTINGSAATAISFRKHIERSTGQPFENFTALHFIRHLSQTIALLLVHDDQDDEVSIEHAYALLKHYPQATLFRTNGLGHTRILRDEKVIEKCLSFLKT